jgi:Spy/CpxP family protein refolding chaperone
MKTSLKLLASLAGLVLLTAPVLRAQDAAPATPPADKPEHRKGERGGPGGGPGAMMERAAKELDLTADQQAKWKAIAEQEKTALEALRKDESVAKADKGAKRMEINKTYGDQRKAVLTADQAAKFDDMRAKMRERGGKGPKKDKPAGDKPDAN